MSGQTHDDFLRANGLAANPQPSRFHRVKGDISELERLAEKNEAYAAIAPDPSTGRRHAERAATYRRRLMRAYEALECFSEPEPMGECRSCSGPMTRNERYSSPTCTNCRRRQELD